MSRCRGRDPAQAIDSSNLGKYLFEVRDAKTKQLLYSRGFASIYGEWETTDEAKTVKRTFQKSLRFPAPSPVSIVLKKRDARTLSDIWTTTIDPADQFIDRSKPTSPAPVITIQKTGDPETGVDFLILGDGYTAAEAKKFEADARRLTERFSRLRRSKRIARASMFGRSVHRRPNQAFRDLQPASIATLRSARLTMRSDRKDTC